MAYGLLDPSTLGIYAGDNMSVSVSNILTALKTYYYSYDIAVFEEEHNARYVVELREKLDDFHLFYSNNPAELMTKFGKKAPFYAYISIGVLNQALYTRDIKILVNCVEQQRNSFTIEVACDTIQEALNSLKG